jgi:hypothetical protein
VVTKVESSYLILARIVFAAAVLKFFVADVGVWEVAGFRSHGLLGWLVLVAAVACSSSPFGATSGVSGLGPMDAVASHHYLP